MKLASFAFPVIILGTIASCNLFSQSMSAQRQAFEQSACVIVAYELGASTSDAATGCGVAVELAETIIQGYATQKSAKMHHLVDAGAE